MSLCHLLFDLETLGVRENAVILSAACVPFYFEVRESFQQYLTSGFSVKFDVKEQFKKYHRTTDQSTTDWWAKQSKEARDWNLKPNAGDRTLLDGLTSLSKFIGGTKYVSSTCYVWTRGSHFDYPKIENAYEMVGLKCPLNPFKVRDVRTYVDIMAGVSDANYDLKFCDTSKFIKHDCLNDAAMDAARMTELYYIAMENPAF